MVRLTIHPRKGKPYQTCIDLPHTGKVLDNQLKAEVDAWIDANIKDIETYDLLIE